MTKASSGLIAGLDEVGMGCLAGPVVIVVAAFPEEAIRISGVRDSKKCSRQQIEALGPVVAEQASFLGLGFSSAEYINEHGLAQAWHNAAEMALANAPPLKELIVDGVRRVDGYRGRQHATPKADLLHWQVSAASIVAKGLRDNEMEMFAEIYPGYGWERNVGYGTKEHIEAIALLGTTELHRTQFVDKALKTMRRKNQAPSRF
jgi:ribonuclease HII